MLSPASPALKNLSVEDSSGSDPESEVGPEPETDRFGFILTNGSTAGSVGPSPELVRQRETKWINIISQWDRMLLKKTSKIKVQCQKGIPASLRAKCWPLLCGATDKMKYNENLYQSLDSQPTLQSWVDVIERDLDRQFPFHEMFLSKDGHGQRGLFRVLKAYTQYQPEEGYCQAQGPVAAVLLMNMPAEEAFWCLVQISEQYLPGYYSPLLEGVLFDASVLTWVLKRTCPAAHKHLQHYGVEPLMFATDWLMCLFTRHLPFNTLLRVWDLFFCYGVRVLLQVAVVLVRRVLGRAEQRKQCQGQMETLERLRGVREEVQEEDDAFIAEVCSVQLSARDLEKQTQKELEKWRKDKPSSTFDPRGRCQGYRMAWARARQSEEELDRKAREKGNLSAPLARSASTLSLSPSLLQKKWRKGGKASTREWESGGRVVRHLSMGAKEDWRSWTEINFKKVQGVQEEEDVVFEEHKKQSEPNVTGNTEQKELLKESKKSEVQNVPTEETVIIKEQIVQDETRVTEKQENRLKETEESKVLSEQTEKINVETEPTHDPNKDETVKDIIQPAEHENREELDSSHESQVLEHQPPERKHLETEVIDTSKEKEEQSECTAAVEETQTEIQKDADKITEVETQESVDPIEEQDMKPEENAETENVQQVDTAITESSLASDTDNKIETPAVKDPPAETETQQQDVITETDKSLQGDALDGKCHSTESLAETDMTAESHTQMETDSVKLAQTQEKVTTISATQCELEGEKVQTESEQPIDSKTEAETLTPSSPECTEPEGGPDSVAETETEAEIPAANDIVTESSEAAEEECDAAAQREEERSQTAHSEVQVDNNQAEETTKTEATDSIATPQEEVTTTQAEAVTLTAEPDGKMSSVGTSKSEEPAPEQPMSQVTVGAVEEGEITETVKENAEGEDEVFISTEPTDSPNNDKNPQVQDKDSDLVKDQKETDNGSLSQASGLCSSRSSGDFCIRKSSSSHGSRSARRLSENLFTMPEKNSQSKPDHSDVKHSESQSKPGAEIPMQSPAAATETAVVQPDPPKRFGLLHRLRGEQPKKAPKIQVPKILIQDFSDGTGTGEPVEEEGEKKLSSKERRRRRRERERREKEEERSKKKREKEQEKERRKPQTKGKSFQVQNEKGSSDVPQPASTGHPKLRYSASFTQTYF
ncbi:ecotropic viral integration site 5 ortholog isoform X2 [Plectropomus leopardus]|nr:ecotropic viral integration site 5 ortholog isoform X2 [Plectropomus leopardus]